MAGCSTVLCRSFYLRFTDLTLPLPSFPPPPCSVVRLLPYHHVTPTHTRRSYWWFCCLRAATPPVPRLTTHLGAPAVLPPLLPPPHIHTPTLTPFYHYHLCRLPVVHGWAVFCCRLVLDSFYSPTQLEDFVSFCVVLYCGFLVSSQTCACGLRARVGFAPPLYYQTPAAVSADCHGCPYNPLVRCRITATHTPRYRLP